MAPVIRSLFRKFNIQILIFCKPLTCFVRGSITVQLTHRHLDIDPALGPRLQRQLCS